MYGAQVLGSLTGADQVLVEFEDGGTFAANDFVKMSSGVAVVATAGASILGVAMEAGSDSANDVSINITPQMVVLMDNDNDSDTFAETDEGLFGDFTGGTEVMQVDTDSLSTTKAQLYCVKYNPQGFGYDSDISIGKFLVVERETSGQAAA